MKREQVRALAQAEYGDQYEVDDPSLSMFALLVDVADAYVAELEAQARFHPAPFFAGSTPMECAMNGLVENLEMLRNDRRG